MSRGIRSLPTTTAVEYQVAVSCGAWPEHGNTQRPHRTPSATRLKTIHTKLQTVLFNTTSRATNGGKKRAPSSPSGVTAVSRLVNRRKCVPTSLQTKIKQKNGQTAPRPPIEHMYVCTAGKSSLSQFPAGNSPQNRVASGHTTNQSVPKNTKG